MQIVNNELYHDLFECRNLTYFIYFLVYFLVYDKTM